MRRVVDLLRRPWVQRGIRAAVAAGLAWQIAVLLPTTLSEYAFYAPLGAVIAVHPTVADSASAAWRTVAAMFLGFGLAVAVYEFTRGVPNAVTIALIVGLAIVVEQWKLLREQDVAVALRLGHVPGPADWEERGDVLDVALDRMRRDEQQVERARRANPRAHRWQGRAASIREQSRALDRVAVLIDDLTTLVVEFQPHRRGLDRVDDGTGYVLAEGLAGVVRTPYHQGADPDPRDDAIVAAVQALDRLTHLLRDSEIPDDEGFFALGAVTVGMRRSLQALDAHVRHPQTA